MGVYRSAAVTADDLEWAATWLEAYEGDDGTPAASGDSADPYALNALRVAAWLRREVARRRREVTVTAVLRGAGMNQYSPHERRRAREIIARADAGDLTSGSATDSIARDSEATTGSEQTDDLHP